MIVADASVVFDALAGPGDAQDRLLADAVEVPHLIDAEIAHALRGQVRRGRVGPDVARDRLARWIRFPVRRHDALPLMARVWDLRDVLSAYDAMYAALAEALRCPLLTADLRLARAPGVRCEVVVVRRG